MKPGYLEVGSNAAAIGGILVCALAGGARLLGSYYLFGYEALTLFLGGVALMVFAVLIKVHLIKIYVARKG